MVAGKLLPGASNRHLVDKKGMRVFNDGLFGQEIKVKSIKSEKSEWQKAQCKITTGYLSSRQPCEQSIS